MRDVIALSVFRHRMEALAEEMGSVLQRTATAPNIKERRDYSCAVFDAAGRLAAQGAHLPVHLGSMAASVAAVMDRFELRRGDVGIINDPFHGGTHLPDITLVSAVEADDGERIGYVATRAHHVDVGGISPGSMPLATEIFQEGVIIPPSLLRRGRKWDEGLLTVIAAQVRRPDVVRADLRAQLAAQDVGARRLLEVRDGLVERDLAAAVAELVAYTERATRAAIAEIPDGRYQAEDQLDEMLPGGDPVRIAVTVDVRGDELHVDFAGSDPQRPGPLNAVETVTRSAVYYCVRCLLRDEVPMNHGCFAPVTVAAPAGSVVNARHPAAVSGGNVETSQRIVDVVLRALAPALPERMPAAGQGTMNNVTFGGHDRTRGRPFVWYETLGGGTGAGPEHDGLSAVHVAMSNTRNTPVEAIEFELPVRIGRYAIRRGSGGEGRHRGGDGVERVYEFLEEASGTVISERRRLAPWGLRGGAPGGRGENELRRADGSVVELGGKAHFDVAAGDSLVIRTPGGGGWGAG